MKVKSESEVAQSYLTLSDPMDCRLPGSSSMGLSRQEYWSGVPPMSSMKRQKDTTLKDELPRLVGNQYGTGDQWRNNSRKNEEMEPKQKQHPVVDVTGDESKV